jgi:hypothetical protein
MSGFAKSPFLLDGGRAGDGGVRTVAAQKTRAGALPRHLRRGGGHTTTQPSSIEEEGFL